ncbi:MULTISPECIES: alpha/beta hydrolase [unclassified Caballeronia]|uniref:alpha/beta fold hydrolase n=1 Tax=unclassified Caballeronia TaxID=2646786 RepID=UPI0020296BF0|nr:MULTISPECIES: alpha/beta hydrolase [unclassified Caballeronia]MDR5785066.1 alpha/beta hydrolase [Caballeronia sp. LP003]
MYQAEASGFHDTGEVSLRYDVRGSGAGMVLFHELGGSVHSWDGVIDALSAQFRVLRFDQRGHGLSEKVRRPFCMTDHANDAMQLARHLAFDGQLWLVGVAAGAAAALAFAARFADRVAGIVLCAPALSTDAARRSYLEARMQQVEQSGMRAIADASLDRSYPADQRADTRFDTYRARWLANDPVSYGLANGALIDFTLDDRLSSIDCPCLLLAGRRDPLRPPSYVRSLVPLFADARYAELDCAHVMPVQAPDELTRHILDFTRDCRAHPGVHA